MKWIKYVILFLVIAYVVYFALGLLYALWCMSIH